LLTNQTTAACARLPLARSGAILECMSRRIISAAALAGFAALAVLHLAAPVRADEIKLKDGSKIYGTIVGFEDNSFKVKTSYGFAVVQKDQVVSITVTGDANKPDTDSAKKPDSDAAKKPEPATAKKSSADAVRKTESAAAKTPVATPTPAVAKPEKVEHASTPSPARNSDADSATNSVEEYPHMDTPTTPATKSAQPASAVSSTAAASSAPSTSNTSVASNASTPFAAAAPAAKPAAPEPMREEVSGNLYTNDTYGFRMYKPPTWKLIEGARTILPGSITALGTDDQNTYLLIGQAPTGKSLANDIAATEQRLHDVMENFRPLGEKQVMISGVSATERRFRGSVDSRDWSGVVVYIPRGERVYTIFGMTLADTDLVQIQENVISRAITSLQFTK
jgi:outer membrane biosynthesis protein TonB